MRAMLSLVVMALYCRLLVTEVKTKSHQSSKLKTSETEEGFWQGFGCGRLAAAHNSFNTSSLLCRENLGLCANQTYTQYTVLLCKCFCSFSLWEHLRPLVLWTCMGRSFYLTLPIVKVNQESEVTTERCFPHFDNCMSIGIPLSLSWILFSSFFLSHFLWYCRWLWWLHYQQYHVSRVLCHITASFSIQSPFHHPVCSQSSSRSWWRTHPFICAASHVIRRDCCSACIAT